MRSKCLKSLISLFVLFNVFVLSAFATRKSLNAAAQQLSLPAEQICKLWDSNALRAATSATVEPTFSVYGRRDGKGFAIVAGERILGYSDDGEITSPDGLPEPMLEYLLQLDEELRCANVQQAAKAPGNVVVELQTANWAQRDPFNRMCPIKNGYRCLTGCIPTAFAIEKSYHRWPVHGTGKVYNRLTGEAVDISSHTYNWDEMLMQYNSGNYTDAQANEVAALMMHLGFAYMVEYSPSNTGGNHNSSTLAKNFGYVDVGKTQRWQVGDTEWVRLIKESLDNGCPVPYSATNSGSGSGDAKHIFVLDGYTDNGYYHFNWGWGGNGNGYFQLTAMKPFDGDNYSKADSHQAYFNLRPDRVLENYTVSVSATEGGTATVNDAQSVTVQEGTIVTLRATANEGYDFAGWSVGGTTVSTNAVYTATVTASVEYVANFEKKAEVKKYTVSVSATEGGTATVNGGQSVTVEEGSLITLRATAHEGYSFIGWSVDGTTVSTNAVYVATATASVEYVANFEKKAEVKKYTVSVSATEGGTATVNGGQSVTVEEGSLITLRATAHEGYSFIGWSVDGATISTNAVYVATATASVEYVANFEKKAEVKKYTVSVQKSNYGKVYIGKEGVTSVEAEEGSKLTLYAIAHDGYNFLNWTLNGAVISTSAATTITVEASAQYVAHFEKIETGKKFTVELYCAGKGGKVYIDDDKACTRKQVEQGTIVEIHAVADQGYEFDYWAIDDGGFEYPLQGAEKDAVINVLSNFTFYAYFKVSTSVGNIQEAECTVGVKGNKLQVNGYNGTLHIYTVDGARLKDCFVENSLTVELPKGVYIVSLGKKNLIVNIK